MTTQREDNARNYMQIEATKDNLGVHIDQALAAADNLSRATQDSRYQPGMRQAMRLLAKARSLTGP